MNRTSKTGDQGKDEAPVPMDPSISETRVGAPKPNNARVCWALQTLVAEIHALFPETPVEYSEYDGRNTALAATFDLTALDEDAAIDLANLLRLLGDGAHSDDPRIEAVVVNTEGDSAVVAMRASLRTQDRRDSFGLADAYSILTEPEEIWDDGDSLTEDDDIMDGGGA